MKKVPPPDFAGYLADANHGRVNHALTERFGEMMEAITSRASEFGTEWDGEFTLTLKFTADKYGGVECKAKSTHKVEAIPLPGAKMYYNPDTGGLTTEEPRQVKIPGFDDELRERKVKSPDAPERK